jgi:FtsP/CotA-like multicopper oxidase with cupredoxin domain
MSGQMMEHHHMASAHAAMIGEMVPAPDGLDLVLAPPPAYQPGPVREYNLVAVEREIEVAKGVFFAAWAYGLTGETAGVPGPTIRVTEGQTLRVNLVNASTHPHTIHFHGIHPANMDGVFEVVDPGGSFTYEFPAAPAGMHLYHCHATPLKKHIAKGLYGALIIDPEQPLPPAQELVMVMNGFDTNGDGENEFYTVNGKAFYYARHPIRVRRSQTVRIYLANLTEFDLINSFHLHGEFFRYHPIGFTNQSEYTDTVVLAQGQRGIVEIDFHQTGHFMFHAHVSEFTELGWMGFFEVVE